MPRHASCSHAASSPSLHGTGGSSEGRRRMQAPPRPPPCHHQAACKLQARWAALRRLCQQRTQCCIALILLRRGRFDSCQQRDQQLLVAGIQGGGGRSSRLGGRGASGLTQCETAGANPSALGGARPRPRSGPRTALHRTDTALHRGVQRQLTRDRSEQRLPRHRQPKRLLPLSASVGSGENMFCAFQGCISVVNVCASAFQGRRGIRSLLEGKNKTPKN